MKNNYSTLVKTYIRPLSRCELCGTDNQLTIHHIIARTKDGPSDRWNLAILCYKCHNIIEAFDFDKISEYRFYIQSNAINKISNKFKTRPVPKPFIHLRSTKPKPRI